MTHRRDRGHSAPRNGARDDFFVEGPEILDRAAAAPDDHNVNALHLADRGHRPCNVERRAFALYARRTNDDVGVRVAAPQHFDDVAHGSAVERRDNADLARQCRQRPLATLVEEPFARQPLLQLIERQLPGAEPFGLEMLADESGIRSWGRTR
jgi:hypothetical protein